MSEEKAKKEHAKIAAIRIRGEVRMSEGKNETMDMLRLGRVNYCVVLNKTPSIIGMLKKVQDCITWGEIDDSTLKELKAKRGEKIRSKGKESEKKYFRLNPPRGGYERKGIKVPYAIGGALGYRGNEINSLIRRML